MIISGRSLHFAFIFSLLAALLLQLVELPELLSGARPLWLPLFVAYWALTESRTHILLGAFILGMCADVCFGTTLGQHELGLVLVAYFVTRLRPIFVLFPLWQATLALIPVWVGYSFLMFWIDGITNHRADAWLRWLPVVSTSLFWPLVFALMELVRGGRNDDE
ncbi:MAG: rod shape-determining protein MreD [Pseudomonadota bacterium]